MRKIYLFKYPDGNVPFLDFMTTLDEKAQRKLEYALKSMAIFQGRFTEPQVKHFSIERYRHLYELREKSRVLIRVIFTLDGEGNVILLHPFIKRHKRNTNQALETSLVMLEKIRQYPNTLMEYPFHGGLGGNHQEEGTT